MDSPGPWTVGWDTLAVFATFALALVTAWMALETRRVAGRTEDEVKAVSEQATAAGEEVAISRAALEASNRPVLVSVPPGVYLTPRVQHDPTAGQVDRAEVDVYTGSGYARVQVPVRNAGNGLGFIRDVQLVWPEAIPGDWSSETLSSVVAPGDLTRVTFQAWMANDEQQQSVTAAINGFTTFAVDVNYSDVDGAQVTRARIELERAEQGRWRATKTHLFKPGETEPFVSSGVSD